MLEEWKVRQDVYHKMHCIDDLRDQKTQEATLISGNTEGQPLVDDIMVHFTSNPEQLIYPAKSYFVAIIYAKLIADNFNESFYTLLDDADLLYGNDPHFVPYSKNQEIYDAVLERVGGYENIDTTMGQCPDVNQYFLEEFLIG